MKYKPHLFYNPKTRKSKIIYIDINSLDISRSSLDSLEKISHTSFSPLKMLLVRKSNFSLIEIIIGASLFAILLFSTTSLFFRYQTLNAKIALIRPVVFEHTLFFQKITQMTMTLDKKSIKTSNPLYSQYLEFTFDNGFKDLSTLSGECCCKLYKNFDNDLIYTITSSDGTELSRVILSNIDSFTSKIDKELLYITVETLSKNIYNYSFILPENKSGESS